MLITTGALFNDTKITEHIYTHINEELLGEVEQNTVICETFKNHNCFIIRPPLLS